jgi:hypothetical protein
MKALLLVSHAVLLAALASSAEVAPHDDARHAEECLAGTKLDCVVSSEWSVPPSFGFSACSTTCGQGLSTRIRSIIHDACNGGQVCPALSESVECMHQVCTCDTVACKYETHSCTTSNSEVQTAYLQAGNTGFGVCGPVTDGVCGLQTAGTLASATSTV